MLGRPNKPWIATIVISLVGAVGIHFAGVAPLREVEARESWKPTECTVLSTRITNARIDDGPLYYYPRVTCGYELSGRRFESETIVHIESRYDNDARAKLKQYPEGTAKTCYVNPNHPNEFFLENPTPRGPFVLIVVILLVTGIFLLVPWVTYRQKLSKYDELVGDP